MCLSSAALLPPISRPTQFYPYPLIFHHIRLNHWPQYPYKVPKRLQHLQYCPLRCQQRLIFPLWTRLSHTPMFMCCPRLKHGRTWVCCPNHLWKYKYATIVHWGYGWEPFSIISMDIPRCLQLKWQIRVFFVIFYVGSPLHCILYLVHLLGEWQLDYFTFFLCNSF